MCSGANLAASMDKKIEEIAMHTDDRVENTTCSNFHHHSLSESLKRNSCASLVDAL